MCTQCPIDIIVLACLLTGGIWPSGPLIKALRKVLNESTGNKILHYDWLMTYSDSLSKATGKETFEHVSFTCTPWCPVY